MAKLKGAGKWNGPARSNTGRSIRGIPISNPIPIPDDEEFPIRTPGTGIATPVGSDPVFESQMRVRSLTTGTLDNPAYQTGIAISDYVNHPAVTYTATVTAQPLAEAQKLKRTHQPSSARNSAASDPSASSLGKHQRKKSSLRLMFGRIFGSKKGKGNKSSTGQQLSDNVRAEQHLSDPTALQRIPKGAGDLSQKRSQSLPVNEFNRALRSHSVVLEDLPRMSNEKQVDLSNRDSQQPSIQGRPRRATTPSRLWTPNRTPGVDWTGLSPRPASGHARSSRVIGHTEDDLAIGAATTVSNHPHRRSRSLGELRLATGSNDITRRRSDEIRYWRESQEPGLLSPLSSAKPDPEENAFIDEEDVTQDENEEPREQPQPFNFGPLGEMAGMKITHAASFETRVNILENRMLKVERAVFRAELDESPYFQGQSKQNSTNDQSIIGQAIGDSSELSLPRYPRNRDARSPQALRDITGQESRLRFSSYESSRPSTVSTQASGLPSSEAFPAAAQPMSELGPRTSPDTARPLSTSTTIRGYASNSPTMPKDGTLTVEHYTALTNMIIAEQAARQHLEDIIRNLQQQLNEALRWSRQPPPGLHQPTKYPSPRNENNGNITFSNFEQAGNDRGAYYGEEGFVHQDPDQDLEDFRTPLEEPRNFGDEIFGEVVNNEQVKRVPRTLSLSQMTQGKAAGFHQGVHF